MSWTKKIVGGFTYLAFLSISVAILLEVIFRILPTSDSTKSKKVNIDYPIIRFEENRDITKQIGFNFKHINVKHINNYGYASDKDFKKKELQTKPIIAVIGDSYVEAMQVKNKDAFHAILDKGLLSHDVYPIGISGSPLSQYIAFSRYAAEQFSPELYVFLIIENDFDESFKKVKNAPGFHYFNETEELTLVEYDPSIIKKILRKSAFVRYLYLDLQIKSQINRLFKNEHISKEIQTNTNMNFLELGQEAIDKFLHNIKDLTGTSKVIILLDGDRTSIYNGEVIRNMNKPANILYEELKKLSISIQNLDIVDLHNFFLNDWVENGKKFNYDYDYHWNEYGHAVVAQILLEKIKNGKLSIVQN
jgi:hypothetical protein